MEVSLGIVDVCWWYSLIKRHTPILICAERALALQLGGRSCILLASEGVFLFFPEEKRTYSLSDIVVGSWDI